jgi:outer membrane biosynthesis protein TonB
MQQHLGGYEEREDDSVELVGDDRLDEFAAPRRRWPTAVLTGAVMAIFAGGLWFFSHQGGHQPAVPGPGGDVPLIRADNQPMKVKPDNPGGMPVPDQNVSVYDPKPAAASVEKLLPPPEQPLPRPVPKEPATPPAPAATAPPAQPAPAATQAPQQQAAVTPVPKAPPKPAARETSAAAAPKSVPTGPVRIQLASLRSPEAAKEEWGRLKREHPDTLGKLTAVAVRVDLGDKGVWYRVETQVFDDPAAADRLCGDLKKQKIGCSLAH